jgi:phenylalanyl-tRNA synthetase alpha chain
VVHVGLGVCILTPDQLSQALALRDLSDETQGVHAVNLLVHQISAALQAKYGLVPEIQRGSRIVSVLDNYDRLYDPPGGAARDSRYTRYVAPDRVLRTQMTAVIPGALRSLRSSLLDRSHPDRSMLILAPGIVYRRDVVDRLHCAEPHQMDVWLVSPRPVGRQDLLELIDTILHSALPGCSYRCLPATRPYTVRGLEVEVHDRSSYTEVLECGEILPQLLDDAGLPSASYAGLALGKGLDRLVMLRKGLDDIRLLRASDPRVAGQMNDLAPYRPVSRQPPIRRNLSVAVEADLTLEEIGDRVRTALGNSAEQLEEVALLDQAPYNALPAAVRDRLGMTARQKNVLLALTIRAPTRSIPREEANALAQAVYRALHQGDRGYL